MLWGGKSCLFGWRAKKRGERKLLSERRFELARSRTESNLTGARVRRKGSRNPGAIPRRGRFLKKGEKEDIGSTQLFDWNN